MAAGNAGVLLGRLLLTFVAKTDELDAALARTQKGISELAVAGAKVGTSFTALGATSSLLFDRMLAPMKESIKLAADLNHTLNAVTNIMQHQGIDGAQRYKDEIKALSRAVGVDLTDAVKGFRRLVESGIPEDAAVITLRKSAELARISMVDLNVSLDAVRTSIKAWNMDMGGAVEQTKSLNKVSYQLFQAFNYAAGSSEDFQKAFAKTAGVFAEAKVSMEDALAAGAALTRVGLQPAQGFTSLTNVVLSFLKPTEKSIEYVERLNKQLGLTGDAALELSGRFLEKNGLNGSLEMFAEAAKKTGDAGDTLAHVFSRKGAIVSVFGLLANNFKDAREAMLAMRDYTAGLHTQFEKMNDPLLKMQQTMQQFNSISDSLGSSALPTIGKALDFVNPLLEKFNLSLEETPASLSLVSTAIVALVGGGAYLSKFITTIGLLSFSLVALYGAFSALFLSPMIKTGKAVFEALTADFAKFVSNAGKVGESLTKIRNSFINLAAGINAKDVAKGITESAENIRTAAYMIGSAIADIIAYVQKLRVTFAAMNFTTDLAKISTAYSKVSADLRTIILGFAGDRDTLEISAKAVNKVMLDLGKLFKEFTQIVNPADAGLASMTKRFNSFFFSSADALKVLSDLRGELEGVLKLLGTSAKVSGEFPNEARRVVQAFADLVSAFQQSKNPTQEFLEFIKAIAGARTSAPVALKEIQEGIKAIGASSAMAQQTVKELMDELLRLSSIRGSLDVQAQGIVDALKEIGHSGAGLSSTSTIAEWIERMGVAVKGGKISNAFSLIFTEAAKGVKVLYDVLQDLTKTSAKFAIDVVSDWTKWSLIIDTVLLGLKAVKDTVGLFFDIMQSESSFGKLTEDTRRLVTYLDSMGVTVDKNTLSIIKNTETNARWATVIRSVVEGFKYFLLALENFGPTIEIAMAQILKTVLEGIGAIGDLISFGLKKIFGVDVNLNPFTKLIKAIDEFKEKTYEFIAGQKGTWDITKRTEEYLNTLDKTIAKYDDVRAALRKWVDDVKKAVSEGKMTPELEATMRAQMEQQIQEWAALYEKRAKLEELDTEKRLEEFKKQADGRRQQLETELKMFNDYFYELDRYQKSLQSELSGALDYRDQLKVAANFAVTPTEQAWVQQEIVAVSNYINALREEIMKSKRELLDAELSIQEQIVRNWKDTSVEVVNDVSGITNEILQAGKEAAYAQRQFDQLFQKMSQGLSDTDKQKLKDILTLLQDQQNALYTYLKDSWAPEAGAEQVRALVNAMLAEWNRQKDSGELSKQLVEGMKSIMMVTEDELNKYVESKTWENSALGHFFDGAIESSFDSAKKKIDEEVPALREHLWEAIKEALPGADAAKAFGSFMGAGADWVGEKTQNAIDAAKGALGYSGVNTGQPTALQQAWYNVAGLLGLPSVSTPAYTNILETAFDKYQNDNSFLGIVPNMTLYKFAQALVDGDLPVEYDVFYYAALAYLKDAQNYTNPFTLGFAKGGQAHMGGLALVGEEGPELVNLPAGTTVMPAKQTKRVLDKIKQVPAYADGVGRIDLKKGSIEEQYGKLIESYGVKKGSQEYLDVLAALSLLASQQINTELLAITNKQLAIGNRLLHPEVPYYEATAPFVDDASLLWTYPIIRKLLNYPQPQFSTDRRTEEQKIKDQITERLSIQDSTKIGMTNTPLGDEVNLRDLPEHVRKALVLKKYGVNIDNRPSVVPMPIELSEEKRRALLLQTVERVGDGPYIPLSDFGEYYGLQDQSDNMYVLGEGEHTRPRRYPYEKRQSQNAEDDQVYGFFSALGLSENTLALELNKYIYRDQGLIADAIKNGIVSKDRVDAWIIKTYAPRRGLTGKKVNRGLTGHMIFGSPRIVGAASSKVKGLRPSSGDFISLSHTGTGPTNFYTTPTENTITHFVGDLEGIARSGKYTGIPQFDQALAIWRKMEAIAKKYGYSTTWLANNSSVYGDSGTSFYTQNAKGVSTKPKNVSDADVIAFHALYKQAMALFYQAQQAAAAKAPKPAAAPRGDGTFNFYGGMATGGDVDFSGTYIVGEKGPELVYLNKGSSVIASKYLSRARSSSTKHVSKPKYGLPGGKRKSGGDILGKWEAEMRAAPLNKLKAFVHAAIPNGGSVISFKDWSVNDLVDYILNTVTVQSGASVGSLYSLWKRIDATSVSSFMPADAAFDKKKYRPSDPSDDRRTLSGAGGGGASGSFLPDQNQGGGGGSTSGKRDTGGVFSTGSSSTSTPAGGTRKKRKKEMRGRDYAVVPGDGNDVQRGTIFQQIPNMDHDAMVRLLQLLVGVSAADAAVKDAADDSVLADYIINDVIQKKKIKTSTLVEYYKRAITTVKKPVTIPSPPAQKKVKGPLTRRSGASHAGASISSVSTVSSIASAYQYDTAATSEMQRALSGDIFQSSSATGAVTQNFNVGNVRTDEDIARIAVMARQKQAKARRRTF